jgi:hypothetical protein
MARYVLQAPNCWHQFGGNQIEKRALRVTSGVGSGEGGVSSGTVREKDGVGGYDGEGKAAFVGGEKPPRQLQPPLQSQSHPHQARHKADGALATVAGVEEKERRRWFVNA